ncbi:hypothetical protein DLEV_151 [Diachasmimorpha longicaudata entomopoxvirus]|uniref:Uncharacterized protein n=1 Tax=Diachasmimorpha longicaudata entomopoxvirus TaxID=109981 RepID=A0A7R5WD85_9POXV|nr:hypothetical protein QKK69_gp151 [Diachasmimorpha longicaudata entomopoxvirus]AKS26442.1 hypothetical protein DLEV_151 [Diachasmimorpha longicaudata entomopoxvirus]
MLDFFNISFSTLCRSAFKKAKPHLIDSLEGKFWNTGVLALTMVLFWEDFITCLSGNFFFGLDLFKLYLMLQVLNWMMDSPTSQNNSNNQLLREFQDITKSGQKRILDKVRVCLAEEKRVDSLKTFWSSLCSAVDQQFVTKQENEMCEIDDGVDEPDVDMEVEEADMSLKTLLDAMDKEDAKQTEF